MAAGEDTRPVAVERRGSLAVLRLARPAQRNALSVDLIEALCAALAELESDPGVTAAVLAGAGRSFSAGGDLGDIAARVGGGEEILARVDLMRGLQRGITALRGSRLPVVAAVHRHVYGAGWSLALACDAIVAAADTVFCQVFVKRDLVPDLGSAWLLTRAVGSLRARELMLTGAEVDAARALELGLVNRVADSAEGALEAAVELAAAMAQSSPATVGMTKSLIAAAEETTLEQALTLETHAQSLALGSPASRAAIAAFRESRSA
ncbi:MAG TPA: enoyl-CoA hydratase/isomerase family protein [Solirubrobacterales bacterium]|nr:enoyl-CoA hydratase/isomerase family protein [Solirubrobacterales bacterium]